MSTNEWKMKYTDLKQKFLDATDTAYRLGYEQGAKDAQVEMQQMQMQQQQQMQQAMQQQGMPGQEGEMPPEEQMAQDQMGGEELPPEADPEVSQQLDDHINELENLVAKGEKPSVKDLRKVVQDLASLRKSQKEKWSKKISKNTSAQKTFVDSILAKWEKESKDVTADLEEQIKKEGLKIEE